jgi:hypothetical protein
MDSFALLLFAGPVISAIAFFACLVPTLRPPRLLRTLGSIGLLSSLPVALGYLMNSGYPLLILRPATVFFGVLAGTSYLVLSRRFKFPFRQAVAAIALLLGSAWDGVSLFIMTRPGFAGAYCKRATEKIEANTSWVATADKVSHSLRSGSPAPRCHHI